MSRQWLGILRGAISKRIYAVINPSDDSELDNPRLLMMENEELEPVILVREPRGHYTETMTISDLAELLERLR